MPWTGCLLDGGQYSEKTEQTDVESALPCRSHGSGYDGACSVWVGKAGSCDMRNFRKPKLGMALTAIAGPVSNVLLALAALLVRALSYPLYLSSSGVVWEYVILFLEYLVILSAGLAVFNLFPVPPLDGSKVIFSFLPDRWYWKLMRYERYGFLILAALLFLNVLDTPLFYLRDGLIRLLSLIADPVYYFVSTIIRG